MRYQTSKRCGNGIMLTGIAIITLGLLILLLSQTKTIPTFDILPECSVLMLFVGAIIWLAGANLSGKECVCERYFLLRYKQDRSGQHRR